MATYNLIAYGGTGLGYGRNPGYKFVADGNNTAKVVAEDDDAILNDWSDGAYYNTKTAGIYDGDTNSTAVSSEIPWLGAGEMVTSGVWYKLSYTDPVSGAPASVEVFLVWDDTNNYWGGFEDSYVFTTAPLLDGVAYTVTSVENNAGVPWDVLVCFVAGTRIDTADGPVAVDDLTPGDLVQTLDHGLQPVRWIGRRVVEAQGAFAPICIRKGALGNRRDLMVSPQHRMLLRDRRAELFFGEPEVLVAARHLVNDQTIRPVPGGIVSYYHLLFDAHEIIMAEGIPSESLHPNHQSLRGISQQSRREVLALFPELAAQPSGTGDLARPSLKRHEAALLTGQKGHPKAEVSFDC